MVGGPDAFGPGHYGGTKLADVLPVEISADRKDPGTDLSSFTPRFTDAGRSAPVLAPLRALLGEDLPEMPGVDVVGDVRRDATVLLEHPTRKTASGAPMPVLALGEHGSSRTMALTIDGSHRLLFSAFAASAAGRAHGAFWDAMLGWLMRDPRFEPAVIDVRGGCIAGEDTTLTLRPLPGPSGEATVKILRLGSGGTAATLKTQLDGSGAAVELPAGKLTAGGYSAVVEIGKGSTKGPTTRRDFACESGGDEVGRLAPRRGAPARHRRGDRRRLRARGRRGIAAVTRGDAGGDGAAGGADPASMGVDLERGGAAGRALGGAAAGRVDVVPATSAGSVTARTRLPGTGPHHPARALGRAELIVAAAEGDRDALRQRSRALRGRLAPIRAQVSRP